MKKMRRYLALLLAVAMMLSMIRYGGSLADASETSVSAGTTAGTGAEEETTGEAEEAAGTEEAAEAEETGEAAETIEAARTMETEESGEAEEAGETAGGGETEETAETTGTAETEETAETIEIAETEETVETTGTAEAEEVVETTGTGEAKETRETSGTGEAEGIMEAAETAEAEKTGEMAAAESAEDLTTAATVDNNDVNIHMYMVDFEEWDHAITKHWGQNQKQLTKNGKSVDFGTAGSYKNGQIKSGLLKNQLDADGFPLTTKKTGKEDQHLSDLFSEAAGMKEVNGLFLARTLEDTGYLEYNSLENYAYLGDGDTFTVYNQIGTPGDQWDEIHEKYHNQKNYHTKENTYYFKRGNFMPYNPIAGGETSKYYSNLYDENGGKLTEDSARYGEALYATQGTNNYYFGMYLTADFAQPAGGLVKNNGGTEHMVYEFNGDDDLWVYVDGVLLLDIGGIHDTHSGEIDFVSGVITWYDGKDGETAQKKTTTIIQRFQEAGIFPDGSTWQTEDAGKYFTNITIDGKGNYLTGTFADYTAHSFQMFYMERGAYASTLHMKLNLQTVPSGKVSVMKSLTADSDTAADDGLEFQFQIKTVTETTSGEEETYTESEAANQEYLLYENNSLIGTKQTDENGCFTLKNGQRADFDCFRVGQKYVVYELGAYLSGYTVKISGQTAAYYDSEGKLIEEKDIAGSDMGSAGSGFQTVKKDGTVIEFNNTITEKAKLTVKKRLNEDSFTPDGLSSAGGTFRIQIFFNDSTTPYQGAYTLVDAAGNRTQMDSSDGTIGLGKDEQAEITGLAYGTKYKVTELTSSGYYTGTVANDEGSRIYDDGTTDAYAYGRLAGDASVTVTNTPSLDKTVQLQIRKEWKDSAGETISAPEESVTVKVFRDGEEYTAAPEQTLSAENSWTATVDNLPYFKTNGEGKVTGVSQYSVRETKIGKTDLADADYVSNPGSVERDSGNPDLWKVTVMNTRKVKVDLVKVSADAVGTQIDGAVFRLYRAKVTTEGGTTNAAWPEETASEAVTTVEVKEETGATELTGLTSGLYKLAEIKAPDGFAKLSDNIYFAVSDAGEVSLCDENGDAPDSAPAMWSLSGRDSAGDKWTLTVRNGALTSLPSAGGTGTGCYTVCGMMLMIAGALMMYRRRHKGVLIRGTRKPNTF